MFELGAVYTRRQIHDLVGGDLESYLPRREGQVVCGCFDRDINPDAPDVVLAGFGPGREASARTFARQASFVPIFLKARINEWEYVGDFRVRELSERSDVISRYAAESGRDDIAMVLFLEEKP